MSGGEAVYGFPPPVLAEAGPDALQVSPLVPGAGALEDLPDASVARIVVAAPPGALERRYVLAQALRVLAPAGELLALAPKTRGGQRLAAELAAFGCEVSESAKRHHRICRCPRPAEPVGLAATIAEGGLQRVPPDGLWSQPGVFSWDRRDPGSALLIESLPQLSGRGADLGCGVGVLALEVLKRPEVKELRLLDIDRRAVDAARRNVADPRARLLQADARSPLEGMIDLDFVVMNPPFHMAGEEDRGLGLAFIAAAARALRRGGLCLMVANLTLPYEPPLAERFSRVREVVRRGGFKIFEAVR
jgi:16S rRNA (guanine1207-N2)-methyltransferase